MVYNTVKAESVQGGALMAGKSKDKNVWILKNLDRINLTVKKGKKDVIRAHAEERGESVNAFINRAIDKMINEDRKES